MGHFPKPCWWCERHVGHGDPKKSWDSPCNPQKMCLYIYISPSRAFQEATQNMVELHPIYGYIYIIIYIYMHKCWLTLVDTVTVHYWIINVEWI